MTSKICDTIQKIYSSLIIASSTENYVSRYLATDENDDKWFQIFNNFKQTTIEIYSKNLMQN